MAVKPGDILGNKYRVDALIGRGGMGHVFAATDLEQPDTPVAIKVVSRMMFDETLMARLHREAEAASRIRSEYVPRVLEVSDTEDREMFLVMERLVGEPLSQRMRDKGPLPWAEVLQIGEDVLRGVIDAHVAGVVHRDLKPSNVFLAQKGGRTRAMVLDFGVCKMDTVDTEHLTATGESIGTVAYMAPEQIRGASKVDDRADLYAFGVLVFEMLCARLPHDGPSQMAILASKLENEPARIRDCARVPTPDGLDQLISKALVRNPKERFASAQELFKAWRKLGAPDVPASSPALRDDDDDGLDGPHDLTIRDPVSPASPSVPDEVHLTQTALTQGISLRRGGGGRVAFAAAACALVAGVICVAAFFARGPDAASGPGAAAGGESTMTAASMSASPTSSSSLEIASAARPPANAASAETPEAIEIDFDSAGDNGGAAAKADPKKSAPRRPRAAPRSSASHITSQPRY